MTTATNTDTLSAALAEFRAAARKLLAVAEGRYDDLHAAIDKMHEEEDWTPIERRQVELLERQAERADDIAQVARDAVAGMEDL